MTTEVAKEINYMDRVEIESLNIMGIYSLKAGKTTNDECPLCRQDLLASPPEDLQKGNLKVVISIGVCGHMLHKTCIDAHYAKENYSCPVCKTPWNLAKVIPIADFIKKSKEETDPYSLVDVQVDPKKGPAKPEPKVDKPAKQAILVKGSAKKDDGVAQPKLVPLPLPALGPVMVAQPGWQLKQPSGWDVMPAPEKAKVAVKFG